jgi:hypothetical protein
MGVPLTMEAQTLAYDIIQLTSSSPTAIFLTFNLVFFTVFINIH